MGNIKLSLVASITAVISFIAVNNIRNMNSIDDKEWNQIPSMIEIQQLLVDRGYDIEVDGRIGEKTETAWNREICKQWAEKVEKKMKDNIVDCERVKNE